MKPNPKKLSGNQGCFYLGCTQTLPLKSTAMLGALPQGFVARKPGVGNEQKAAVFGALDTSDEHMACVLRGSIRHVQSQEKD